MDFIKKGMISTKYLFDGCEFKKQNNNYKLVSTQNDKYQPFLGQIHSESVWDLISSSTITFGSNYDKIYSLLLDHFKCGHTIFKIDVNLLLKKGEKVIYKSASNIILKEPKSIRVTNSSHMGSSHRYGKNSIGYGVSKSVGESNDVIKQIDVGQIIITNKRFIFSGSKRNIDVSISQITGIDPYVDGFKLHRKNKQKPEYFLDINNNVFNFKWDNEIYFFILNGVIIKSMIEGGLNKKPQTSKLLQLSSQNQIRSKSELIEFQQGDLCLEYDSGWKQIENKKKNRIFTIERTNNNSRAEIHIFTQDIPNDFELFKKEAENIIKKSDFKILNFKIETINNIEMYIWDAVKQIDEIIIEIVFAYFNNGKTEYCLFLSNNVINHQFKQQYYDILNSINFVNNNDFQENVEPNKVNFCSNCGTKISHNGKFCQNCGFEL